MGKPKDRRGILPCGRAEEAATPLQVLVEGRDGRARGRRRDHKTRRLEAQSHQIQGLLRTKRLTASEKETNTLQITIFLLKTSI